MKIGILGAGAVGGYYGGLLQQAGHSVGYVARGETLATLREKGLTLIDENYAETVIHPVVAAETFAEVNQQLDGLDVIIIASKSLPGNATFGEGLDTDPTLSQVPIVTTQNSVEVHYLAAEQFGEDRILAGVIRAYLTRLGPAKIKHYPGPLSLNFGLLSGAIAQSDQAKHSSEIAHQLQDALVEAGAQCKVFDDIAVDIWSKAMYVTTTGELGALADKPLGYLRTELREQLEALMQEVETVGCALGVDYPEGIVEKTLAFADQQIPEATSSMQRDLTQGLPNELDSQVGAICRMGDRAGVPTPLHDLVLGTLNARYGAS